MMALSPCEHCQRHVRVADERCPFCAGALAPRRVRYVGRLPRVNRAAIMALGAALVASCGSDVTIFDDPPEEGGGDVASSSSSSMSSSSSAGGMGDNVTGMGGEMNVDLYGAPTGGFEPIGGSSSDGGSGGEQNVPAYGAPAYGATPGG